MVRGNYGVAVKEKLQKLHNRTAKVITGGILNKLNWKTLEERRKEHKLAYVSKALTNQCPEKISRIFKILKSDRYNLRSNNMMLMLSRPKTNSMKRTFG